MSRGQRVAVAAVTAAVIGWVIALVLLAPHHDDPKPPPPLLVAGARAVDHAAAACRDVASVQDLVKDNADASDVFAYLHVAQLEIAAAAGQEPMWLSLQSGIGSIERGLRENDEGASELGIAIARDQCRRADVYLSGAVRPTGSPGS